MLAHNLVSDMHRVVNSIVEGMNMGFLLLAYNQISKKRGHAALHLRRPVQVDLSFVCFASHAPDLEDGKYKHMFGPSWRAQT